MAEDAPEAGGPQRTAPRPMTTRMVLGSALLLASSTVGALLLVHGAFRVLALLAAAYGAAAIWRRRNLGRPTGR